MYIIERHSQLHTALCTCHSHLHFRFFLQGNSLAKREQQPPPAQEADASSYQYQPHDMQQQYSLSPPDHMQQQYVLSPPDHMLQQYSLSPPDHTQQQQYVLSPSAHMQEQHSPSPPDRSSTNMPKGSRHNPQPNVLLRTLSSKKVHPWPDQQPGSSPLSRAGDAAAPGIPGMYTHEPMQHAASSASGLAGLYAPEHMRFPSSGLDAFAVVHPTPPKYFASSGHPGDAEGGGGGGGVCAPSKDSMWMAADVAQCTDPTLSPHARMVAVVNLLQEQLRRGGFNSSSAGGAAAAPPQSSAPLQGSASARPPQSSAPLQGTASARPPLKRVSEGAPSTQLELSYTQRVMGGPELRPSLDMDSYGHPDADEELRFRRVSEGAMTSTPARVGTSGRSGDGGMYSVGTLGLAGIGSGHRPGGARQGGHHHHRHHEHGGGPRPGTSTSTGTNASKEMVVDVVAGHSPECATLQLSRGKKKKEQPAYLWRMPGELGPS